MSNRGSRLDKAARAAVDQLLSQARAQRRGGDMFIEPLEQRLLFTWIGATSGTTNDAAHDYNNTANWAGGVIDDSFSGVTFTGNTALYLSAPRTTTSNGLNLNYSGNFALTIKSSSTTSQSITLDGPVSGDFGGSANTQTITIGDSADKVPIVLGTSSQSFSIVGSDQLNIVNPISGSASVSKIGSGFLNVESNNTYTGGTTIAGGRIESSINAPGTLTPLGSGAVAITGSGTSGGQFYFGSLGGTSNCTVANAFSISGIGFDSRGALRADGTTLGGLAILSGPITLTGAARIATTYHTGVVTGLISGNYALSSGRDSGGTTIFTAANTYTGGLTVTTGGTVQINNTSGSGTGTGPVTVSSGGTLEGTGTISGAVTVSSGGILSPGDGAGSPGILTVGSVTFASGATFSDEIDGSTVGSGYGQLVVDSTLALGGATLKLTGSQPNNYTASIEPLSDTSSSALTGTFANLPETGVFNSGGVEYVVSYIGGDGNDFSLTYADPLSTNAATTSAPFTVPGTSGTNTVLDFVSQSVGGTEFPGANPVYQNELGFFVVSDSNGDVDGVSPSASNYATTALASSGDQIIFSRGTAPYTLKQISLPAGEQIEFYLVQDATTAEYLSGTFPSTYAADGQQYPQSPQNGRPNVFFMNPAANPGGANLFQAGPANTIYSSFYSFFDSTNPALPAGEGIYDFSINSPIVMLLTAAVDNDQTGINLNWSYLANSGGYDILRTDDTTGVGTEFTVSNVNTTTYTDSTVQAGDEYTYQIAPAAIGATVEHFRLPFSNTAMAKLPGAIGITQPPSDTITGIAGQPVTITLPFTDTDPADTLTGTMNWGDGTSGSPDITTATVIEPSGSTPGTITATQTYLTPGTYSGALTTTSGDGIRTTTPITVIISAPDPTAPVLTAADSSDDTAIDLSWTESQTSHITGYVIEREPAGGSFSVLTTITNPATLSYADTTATPGISYSYEIEAYDTVGGVQYFGSFSNIAVANLLDSPPTVATAASGAVSAGGTSIALSVLGADVSGESTLTYVWGTPQVPEGAAPPTFSDNSDNTAKNTTATVSAPGDYTFQVTITNAAGLATTSDVDVTVAQIPTLSVSPSTATVGAGEGQQFEAVETDQFGDSMDTTNTTWSTDSTDDGSIDADGVYTAPSDATGTYTITATVGSASATASIAVPVSTPDLSASEASDGSGIDVSWDYSDTAANNATGFDLFRQTNGGSWTEIQSGIASTTTSYSDTSVSNGNSYTYLLTPYAMVSGTKVTGANADSSAVAMVGMVNSTATDPILVTSSGSGTTVASFSLPFTDSDSSDTQTATIDWGDGTTDSPDVSIGTVTQSSGSTSASIAGSHSYADGTYTATVTITTSDTNATPTQIPIEIEVGGIPDAPSSASASVSGGAVTLSWSAAASGYAPTGYTIYGSSDGGATWTAVDEVDSSQTSDSLTGLTPSTSYIFQVTAINDFGESAATTATSAITSPALPGAPTSLTATLAGGNAVLNWTAADSLATGYNIYESTDGGSTFGYFDSVTPDSSGNLATTYTAAGLTGGTTPQFYVTAEDASGESAASSSVSMAIPSPVAGVTVTMGSDDVTPTINWTPTTGALGYLVARTPDDGSSSQQLIATLSGQSASSYADTTADPTQAYTYDVEAYFSDPAPAAFDGAGTGPDPGVDDYTGNITGFNATLSGTTANFAWTYQGSTNGFELEEKDTSESGTNYHFIQEPTGRSASVSGLTSGDFYSFRIRADNADGTVSDYATKTVSPVFGDEPTVSAAPESYDGEDLVALTITPPLGVDPSTIASYNVQWQGTSVAGHGWHDASEIYQGENLYNIGDGQTATFRVQAVYDDGTTSDWAKSGQVSIPADSTVIDSEGDSMQDPSPELSLQSITSTSATFKWNIDPSIMSQLEYVWLASNQYDSGSDGSSQTVFNPNSTRPLPATFTVTGLSPGTHYDFMIGTNWFNSDVDHYMYAHADGTTPNAAPPQSLQTPSTPTIIGATYDASVPGGQVTIAWKNAPKNEDGFDILRSDGQMFHVGADKTKYTDTSLPKSGWPWSYQVRATLSGTPGSSYTAPVSVQPVGGPNITEHLLLISKDFHAYFSNLLAKNPAGARAFEAQFVTTIAGAAGNVLAGNTTVMVNQISNWDIPPLFNEQVKTAINSGQLPNGLNTVTVAGSVYQQRTVDYWLYGVMASAMGWNLDDLLQFVQFSKSSRGQANKPATPGQLLWIVAGYNDDTGIPALGASYMAGAGLVQAPIVLPPSDIQGVVAAPLTDDPGPLYYKVGLPPTQYSNSK